MFYKANKNEALEKMVQKMDEINKLKETIANLESQNKLLQNLIDEFYGDSKTGIWCRDCKYGKIVNSTQYTVEQIKKLNLVSEYNKSIIVCMKQAHERCKDWEPITKS